MEKPGTVRHLGVDIKDAMSLSEGVDLTLSYETGSAREGCPTTTASFVC
jgi:hypothetical protein